ncbi:MAG: carbohydrate ABC transporter permease [Clostridia bacterium]|nr:carbohydrate ABC transporter permease [Clostridia bacterium]
MRKKTIIGQTVLNSVFVLLCIAAVAPFVLLVSVSFSNEKDLVFNGYKFWPEHFDISAYKYIFSNPAAIFNAYKVTGIFSILSMFLGVFLMALIAYPLGIGKMRGKSFVSMYLYITMMFSGGLVPSYILITQYLHLDDTIWVYIIPSLISPWYVFMIRTFFQGLPYEIYESSVIDGASEYRIFFQMVIPLSKPVLATVALMTFLSKWNDWNTSLLYINKSELFSLQYLLQKLMREIKLLQDMQGSNVSSLINPRDIPTESVRMAMAVIVAGPALFIFPFFQKYFVKGLTVGSVKG